MDSSQEVKSVEKKIEILFREFIQAVPRFQWVWNGDVWKSIVKFRCRNDLDIVTCKIDHGISIIRKINNKDPLLLDIKNFKELKFKDFYYNHIKYMRILEYEKLIEYIKD